VCGGAEVDCIVDPPADCVGKRDFTLCQVVTVPDRSYDICVAEQCVSPGCGLFPNCNAPAPHFELPDSGQRQCFDGSWDIACPGTPGDVTCGSTTFCGQDGQYGWDISHAATERYSRDVASEPLVTDNFTGLLWQGCVAGKSGTDCSDAGELRNWWDALSYCDGLVWAGFSDWRLPDSRELQSIVKYRQRVDR